MFYKNFLILEDSWCRTSSLLVFYPSPRTNTVSPVGDLTGMQQQKSHRPTGELTSSKKYAANTRKDRLYCRCLLMNGHYRFKMKVIKFPLLCSQCENYPRKQKLPDNNAIMQIFQFVLYFTSGIVRLSSNHLLPGVPHHIFLLFLGPCFGHFSFYSAFFQNASPACLFGGNGVKTQAETAPTLSAASLCLASLISTTTTPREKFNRTPSTFRHGAPLWF